MPKKSCKVFAILVLHSYKQLSYKKACIRWLLVKKYSVAPSCPKTCRQ